MSKAIEGVDYFVRIIDMPHEVHGACSPNDDCTHNVYLNAHDSPERQKEACNHEVKKHIEGEDFSKFDVREIEDI